ncbi:hypothetical protein D3C81_1346470 [compost metagenome]
MAAAIDLDLEVLLVDLLFGITLPTRPFDHPVHETGRATGIQVGALAGSAQHSLQVQALCRRFIIEVGHHPRGERRRRQRIEKRTAATRAPAIMQFEIRALLVQGVGHGDHRRNADTAPQQDRAAGLRRQREQVAWRADLQLAPFQQRLVHAHRAAA